MWPSCFIVWSIFFLFENSKAQTSSIVNNDSLATCICVTPGSCFNGSIIQASPTVDIRILNVSHTLAHLREQKLKEIHLPN